MHINKKNNLLTILEKLIAAGMNFPAAPTPERQAEYVTKFVEKLGEYMYPEEVNN